MSRAVAYLSREVPRWSLDNGCYSCHHNGDGARALFRAADRGHSVPRTATADTTRWLSHPERWEDNGGEGAFSDKRLARIQFSWSLAEAVATGAIEDRQPLLRAADRLARDQAPDGSWPLDGNDPIGSPATYGHALATLAARDVLFAAAPVRHHARIEAADQWLRSQPITTVMDASIELLRPEPVPSPRVRERRSRSIRLLREAQSRDGGWGPFASSPPEPFDTALALLALSAIQKEQDGVAAMIRRGRSFLIVSQLPSGGWPETTRPPGRESDAQHLSTTAWATIALLETEQFRSIKINGPETPFPPGTEP